LPRVCSTHRNGGVRLSLWRDRADASTVRYYRFVGEQQIGSLAPVRQLLGAGADFELAGRGMAPVGALHRCGSALYAWRDGYAPEAWSLSSTGIPFWNKPLMDPSAVLRVLSAFCGEEDGLWLHGITENIGAPDARIRSLDAVRIRVSPYADEPAQVVYRGPWAGKVPVFPDTCRTPVNRELDGG